MEWSNEVVLEFLEHYKREPIIWNVRHKEHTNRMAVHEAWARLRSRMSVQCNILELKNKKQSIMAVYRPLFHRYKAAQDAGTDYKPSWFAFDKLHSFLGGVGKKRNATDPEELVDSNDMNSSNSADSMHFTEKQTERPQSPVRKKMKVISNEPETPIVTTSKEESTAPPFPIPIATYANRSFLNHDAEENETDAQTDRVVTAWCDLVGVKLKEFDEYTREFLMNQIDNYLFRAKAKKMKLRREEKRKMASSASAESSNYPHPVYSSQSIQPLFVEVPASSSASRNVSGDNVLTSLSPTDSMIEVKEERYDLEEDEDA